MNLQQYQSKLKLRSSDITKQLWCHVRKKWLVLTPEEVVRQCALLYLMEEKKHSDRLIAVEKSITYFKVKKRYDIVVFDQAMTPLILIECKSPDVPLDQKSFYQIQSYDSVIDGQHLWLTNGHQNIILAKADNDNQLIIRMDLPHAK
jgi:hypothetical protein